jgi:hypothetical protein
MTTRAGYLLTSLGPRCISRRSRHSPASSRRGAPVAVIAHESRAGRLGERIADLVTERIGAAMVDEQVSDLDQRRQAQRLRQRADKLGPARPHPDRAREELHERASLPRAVHQGLVDQIRERHPVVDDERDRVPEQIRVQSPEVRRVERRLDPRAIPRDLPPAVRDRILQEHAPCSRVGASRRLARAPPRASMASRSEIGPGASMQRPAALLEQPPDTYVVERLPLLAPNSRLTQPGPRRTGHRAARSGQRRERLGHPADADLDVLHRAGVR